MVRQSIETSILLAESMAVPKASHSVGRSLVLPQPQSSWLLYILNYYCTVAYRTTNADFGLLALSKELVQMLGPEAEAMYELFDALAATADQVIFKYKLLIAGV